MTTLKEVIESLKKELVDAQNGYERWLDNELKCDDSNAFYSISDCREMMDIFRKRIELINKHLEMLKKVTSLE